MSGNNGKRGKITAALIAEGILFLVCLAGMTALRAQYGFPMKTNRYFETAAVTAGGRLVLTGSAGEKLYLTLLHGALFLFGNKSAVAAVLQVVLQMTAAVFSYFALRRLAGSVSAFITLAFWGFVPYVVRAFMSMSPAAAVFAAECFAILLISGIWNRRQEKGHPVPALLRYLCAGLLTGLCCTLDISGMAAAVFLFWVVLFCRNTGEGGNVPGGFWNNKAFVFFFTLFAGGLGFAGAQMLMAYAEGCGLYRMLSLWIDRMFFEEDLIRTLNRPESVHILALLFLFCVAVTGSAVRRLLLLRKQKGGTALSGPQEVEPEPEETKPEEAAPQETEPQTEEKKEMQYIENPLPLPKKSEKREMDFDYEVPEDDDFDIF